MAKLTIGITNLQVHEQDVAEIVQLARHLTECRDAESRRIEALRLRDRRLAEHSARSAAEELALEAARERSRNEEIARRADHTGKIFLA